MVEGLSIEKEWEQVTLDSDLESVADKTKEILVESLQLDIELSSITVQMPLLGALPELDSMAVVGLLTTLEEQFGFVVHDEEVTAEVFETFGSLVEFVERNLKQK